jgi:cell cycle arrest protein BUB2
MASFQPQAGTQLHAPPSPGTHRALRRLQSAHSLGAKAANQPSLISQQRHQLQLQNHHHSQTQQGLSGQHVSPSHQQTSGSPIRRNASSNSNNRSPQRHRATSDAPPVPIIHQQHLPVNTKLMPATSATKRSALGRRSLAADGMSLDRLLRDGPPSGDIVGSLESVRLKILDQGIKADSDGMVSLSLRLTEYGKILTPQSSHP